MNDPTQAPPRATPGEPRQALTQQLQQQLAQLRELHASGTLSDEAFAQGRAALERRAADAGIDLAAPTPAAPTGPAPRPPLRLLAGLGLGVLLLAGAGYWWTGPTRQAQARAEAAAQEEAESAAPAAGAASGAPQVTREQVEQMVDRLAAKLKDKPDDPDGWSMLARSQMVLGRASDAIAAYQEATRRRPDDASLLVDHANALALANQRQLGDDAVALLERALEIDPKNLKGLAMSGSAAYARKDFTGAVSFWERLLAQLPPDHELIPQVQASIAEARSVGGLPPAATPVPAPAPATAQAADAKPPAAAAAGASVSGTVRLAPALAAKAAPEDTVFIVARAVDGEGPRMPLAIVRKQVRDLPISFTLDDSLAMSPAAKISGVPRVTVVARISKSGDAMPRPGDLSGQSAPVAVGTRDLVVEIAQEVPQ